MNAFPTLAEQMVAMRQEMAELRAELRAEFAALRAERLPPLAPKDQAVLTRLLPLLARAFDGRPFLSSEVWAQAGLDPVMVAALSPLLPGDGVKKLGKLLGRAAERRPCCAHTVRIVSMEDGSRLWQVVDVAGFQTP